MTVEEAVQRILASDLRDKLVVSAAALDKTTIQEADCLHIGLNGLAKVKQTAAMKQLKEKASTVYWYERLLCKVYNYTSITQLYRLIGSCTLNEDQRRGMDYVLSKGLTEEQLDVIICRVKFNKTLAETAAYLNRAVETVRQTQHKVYRILRNPIYANFYKYGYNNAILRYEQRKAEKQQQIAIKAESITLNTPVSELPISTRTRNVLVRRGFKTVQDIKSTKQLLSYNGLGAAGVDEIRTVLAVADININ